MEIVQNNTKMKIGELVEIRVVHLWSTTLYAVIEGTRVDYFDTLAGALNRATAYLNVQPERRKELLDFLSK